jgi:hypothetical protein
MCQTSVKSQSTDDMSHLPKINHYNLHTAESVKMLMLIPSPGQTYEATLQKSAYTERCIPWF